MIGPFFVFRSASRRNRKIFSSPLCLRLDGFRAQRACRDPEYAWPHPASHGVIPIDREDCNYPVCRANPSCPGWGSFSDWTYGRLYVQKCFSQEPAIAGKKPEEKQPLAVECSPLFSVRNLLTRASDKHNFRVSNTTETKKESWLHPDSSNPISNTV